MIAKMIGTPTSARMTSRTTTVLEPMANMIDCLSEVGQTGFDWPILYSLQPRPAFFVLQPGIRSPQHRSPPREQGMLTQNNTRQQFAARTICHNTPQFLASAGVSLRQTCPNINCCFCCPVRVGVPFSVWN